MPAHKAYGLKADTSGTHRFVEVYPEVGDKVATTITQHIPEKSFQLVHYYGWYSNRARGDRRKQVLLKQEDASSGGTGAINVLNISEPKQKKIPSKSWRESIPKGLPPPEVTIAETIVC